MLKKFFNKFFLFNYKMSTPDLIFRVTNTLYSTKPDTGLVIQAGSEVSATGTVPFFQSGVTGSQVISAEKMVSQISSLKIYEGTKHTINLGLN
jgi:hypothetical protein